MARIRADYVFGTTTAALTTASTTIASAELARLPAVTGSDVASITLHDSATGAYEIAYVTAHTAAATSATILRAQEGSTAQAWASGATWLHGPTAQDFAATAGVVGDHGVKVTSGTTAQSVANQTVTAVTVWANELWDTDAYWSAAAADRFIVPTGQAGRYLVTALFTFDKGTSFDQFVSLARNGTEILSARTRLASTYAAMRTTTVLNLAAGDYLQTTCYQASGSAQTTPTLSGMSEFAMQRIS